MFSDWILNLKLLFNLLFVGYLELKITITGTMTQNYYRLASLRNVQILLLSINTQHNLM